jgi:multiple sugar transport system permease protein
MGPDFSAKGDPLIVPVRRRVLWAPYALLLPSLAFLALFFAVPMAESFGLAFQDSQGSWSLDTIRQMFGEARFRDALVTTLLLIALILPVQFVVALAMALVINARLKASDVWLYIFALPLGTSELSAGIIWLAIFTERGWLNSLLEQIGLIDNPVIWLNYQRPFLLIMAVVLAEAWRATAIMMIIFVAGLQGIPQDYLEAADVFGATRWQKVRRVILPLLRPTIRVALVLRTILALQVFAAIIALTGRGLTVLANEAYRSYAVLRDPRVAAAYATLILLLSILSTGLIFAALPPDEERYTR